MKLNQIRCVSLKPNQIEKSGSRQVGAGGKRFVCGLVVEPSRWIVPDEAEDARHLFDAVLGPHHLEMLGGDAPGQCDSGRVLTPEGRMMPAEGDHLGMTALDWEAAGGSHASMCRDLEAIGRCCCEPDRLAVAPQPR